MVLAWPLIGVRMIRCVVVEDETLTRQGLVRLLEAEGIETIAASDAYACAAALKGGPVDIAVVDLGLPGPGGDTLVTQLAAGGDTVIVVLTATGDPARRIALLDLGADDYVVKPYHPGELMARIRAVLRRRPARTGQVVQTTGWALDLAACLARPTGGRSDAAVPVALTRGEVAILEQLAAAEGKVVSRERLCRVAARPGTEGDLRTVDTLVFRLRRKLARPGLGSEDTIATAPGFGYRLVQGPASP